MESSNDSQSKLVPHEPILTDGRKSFQNSDTPTSSGSSSRYNYYRGSHVFNGVTELNSKRSAGRGGGSHSPHSNHGSFFSNTKPVRDSGEMRYRRPFKSFTTDDAMVQNHAVVDGKHVRILQRPLASGGRLHSDSARGDNADGNDKSSPDALRLQQQQLKRGHRKKTLSLNPEEREALENLVEEVIIDGLGEAIIDSDGTSSSDEDDCDAKGNLSEPYCRPDSLRSKDSGYDDVKDNRLSSDKGNVKDSGAGEDKHHSVKNMGRNLGSRSSGKEYSRRGRENGSSISTKGMKDVKKGSEVRQTKSSPLDEDKDKPNAATVRGVNIYPAQLKVAIKHMDSLPPRFLRRLQTGTSRTAGNESILARLTVKSPTDVPQGTDAFRSDDSSVSPTDRDRCRAKQSQLQETKKTIRNLLCDLDQYTDETAPKDYSGVGQSVSSDKEATSPLLHDSSAGTLAPGLYYGQPYGNKPVYGSPNSLQAGVQSPSQTVQQQSFPFFTPSPHAASAAPRMLSCEEIEREMLHGIQPLNATPAAAESAPVVAPDVMGSVPSFYPPPAQVNQLVLDTSQPAHQQPKKSQFSVDAPEFVSSYYLPNRAASKPSPVAQSAKPFYAVPPPMHSAEMGVQILHNNVHLPSKQAQYPVSVMPPPALPQSASSGPEFVELPPGSAVTPASYEMLQYDQMLRNTPPYIAPVSVQMPLPVSGQSNGVSPMMEMDAMGYPAYQYVPGSNAYSTSYAPGPGFSQTGQPSFIPMPMVAGPTMSTPNWMGDGASQSPMMPTGWYPEYAGMPYANTNLPATRQPGFEDAVYVEGSSAFDEQQMVGSGGAGAARAAVEAGRQKVQQLLNDGASVMVILIGDPDTDNLSLVRSAVNNILACLTM